VNTSSYKSLLTGHWITDLANTSAFIFHELPDLNWAGFYLYDKGSDMLRLGPFQGKPACTEIALNRGVCGHAASSRKTVIVPDVQQFPGHIACDSDSRSEIVIPLIRDGELLGVLDVDSPTLNRFTSHDQSVLEELVAELLSAIKN
jgi:L-methionine (R)-S-oxide reductase